MRKLCSSLVFGCCLAALPAGAQIICRCPAGVQPIGPLWDVQYNCNYSRPWSNEVDPGHSTFTDKRPFPNVTYGIEQYDAHTGSGRDNRRVAFAIQANRCEKENRHAPCEVVSSRYEFTSPNLIRCGSTVASEFGHRLEFDGCDNGERRTCTTY